MEKVVSDRKKMKRDAKISNIFICLVFCCYLSSQAVSNKPIKNVLNNKIKENSHFEFYLKVQTKVCKPSIQPLNHSNLQHFVFFMG